MNKIKSIILDQTNWLEITIVNELEQIIHCESFGDSDEYTDLLNQRCTQFGIELSEDDKVVLAEQKSRKHIPTPEEIVAEEERIAKELIASKVNEAQVYLDSTDYYYPRFLETGETVPEDVVLKRQESRDYIRANKVVA